MQSNVTPRESHKTQDLSLISHCNSIASDYYTALLDGEAKRFSPQPPQPMLHVDRINSPPKASTSSEPRMKKGGTEKKKLPSNQRKNIVEPHSNDVLCGRGASINGFVGNLRWRELIKNKKQEYVQLHKSQRHILSESIVFAVRNLDPPGRFLQRDPVTGLWNDIGENRSHEKTAQALREGASKLRQKIKAYPKTSGEADKKLPAKKLAKKKRGVSSPSSTKEVEGIEELWPNPSSGFASLPFSSTSDQLPAARVPVPATSSMDQFSLPLQHHTFHSGIHPDQQGHQDDFTAEDSFEPLPLEQGHILSSLTASYLGQGSASLHRFSGDASLASGVPSVLSYQQRLGPDRRGSFWHTRDMEPTNQFPSLSQQEESMEANAGGDQSQSGEEAVNPFWEDQDNLLNHAADLILKDATSDGTGNAAEDNADLSKGHDHSQGYR